ncbi:MAG: hypothetical protein KGL39_18225, partial [Patescibacteria group bacterium]|nr:hypothetical protein [Patescibacteria group bacterium]
VISKYKERVLSKKLELSDVEISKRVSKELSAYTQKKKLDGSNAAAPPHVEVARILEERGREVGEGVKVSYVVVDGSTSPMKVIPSEDWTGEYDAFDLWESVVWPPTQRLVVPAFPDYNWAAFDRVRPRLSRKQKAVDPRQTDLLDWISTHQKTAV